MRKYRTINLGGEFEVDLYPLKSPSLKPQLVTTTGKSLEKVKARDSVKALYKYRDGQGREYSEEEVCFKIGERILQSKPRFTQFIKNYAEIPYSLTDLNSRVIASEYFCHCPQLVKKLSDKKMLTFGFSFGNGFAVYQAVLYVMAKEFLVMALVYPNMNRIKTLLQMSQGLNKSTKEIQDNDMVSELIMEQAKLIEVEG